MMTTPETTKPAARYVSSDGNRYEIVTFLEALTRLGMAGRVRGVDESTAQALVAWAPRVIADAGTGRLFAFCSGPKLYSFTVVRKADHLPDEPWAWTATSRSLCIAIVTYDGEPCLECVVPA